MSDLRRAKIMATLGPSSSEPRVLVQLLREGLNVVRLNFSHGDHASHRQVIRTVRELARQEDRFVPIVLDLMGPRYRLAKMDSGPRDLTAGDSVVLGPEGAEVDLPIGDPELLDYLRVGERVLIDNGLIELSITKVEGNLSRALVVHGGRASSRKGINLPDSTLPFTISDKDREDIRFAVEEDVDYIAGSYVGSGADLRAIRHVAEGFGRHIPLIAKLERSSAIAHLEEIFDASDAVMVARGDLGVEIPLHRVPVVQKEIVTAGRRRGKPVIVATQMLESMIQQPRPTRAEASDVANAVFDGADTLMLSGETAAGSYPVEAVRTMAMIIREAEDFQRRRRVGQESQLELAAPPELGLDGPPVQPDRPWANRVPLEMAEVVATAGAYAASRLGVRNIVAFSQGGFTARMIARNRPDAPIYVFTSDPGVARRVQLVWGVSPMLIDAEVDHHHQVVEVVDERLLEAGIAEPGECIVILMGDPIKERPLTNLMRLHRVRG